MKADTYSITAPEIPERGSRGWSPAPHRSSPWSPIP